MTIQLPKFMVSLLETVYGNAATKDKMGYGWLPKITATIHDYIFDTCIAPRSVGQRARPEGFITSA